MMFTELLLQMDGGGSTQDCYYVQENINMSGLTSIRYIRQLVY